ncbi:unnamed protein product [Bursaphelenchus okinawaensis]|uniref:Cyclin N-terminal domain-containing protein n=1 Tax=Bursaphelenchus okinawaensis TaxID=465554 RepID=A0A811LI75_9BILA|nr:unnamed protein product [Bursaphelenchus okinawaensis]CAG9124235.1 unnamed protein product [Bursaphelenchus okinawaensis]
MDIWYRDPLGIGQDSFNIPPMDDFREFGGAETAQVKRYAQGVKLCDVTVNFESYIPSDGAPPPDCRLYQTFIVIERVLMETVNLSCLVDNIGDSTVGLIKPKWYYTKAELMRSPSIMNGFSYEKEQSLLRQAAAFGRDLTTRMNEINESTKLSTLCLSVAIIHMRRFFLINKLQDYDPRDLITAALFLASKSEECSRRLKDFVLVFFRMKVEIDCPKEQWDERSKIDQKTYDSVAAYIVWMESLILQTIGFDMNILVPHTYVLKMCHDFFLDSKAQEIGFFLATDSLHMTDWSLRYSPDTVACIVVFLMVLWKEVEMPTMKVNIDGEFVNKPFFEVNSRLEHEDYLEILHEYTEIWKNNRENPVLAVYKFRDDTIRLRRG